MVRIFLFTFFLSILTLATTTDVRAEADIISAGEPPEVRVETDPYYRYPDIYARQLKYRETHKQLMQDIRDRQKAYVAPHLEVKKKHKADIKALHKSIKSPAQ